MIQMSDEDKHIVEIDGVEYLEGFEPPMYREIGGIEQLPFSPPARRSEIMNQLDERNYTEIEFDARDFVEVLVWGSLLGCIVVVLASLFLVAL